MSTAIVEKKTTISDLMGRVANRQLPQAEREKSFLALTTACAERIFRAIPESKRNRACMVVLNAVRKNPTLLNCNPISLLNAVGEAATYDWEIGGVQSHAYLVPYGDECTLIPGYKGLIELCRRSGQVSAITAEIVHDGDHFDYELGDEARIRHKPAADAKRSERPVTHVYAVVKLRDGGVQRSVWTAADVNAHKEKCSQSWRRAERYIADCKSANKPVQDNKLSAWHTAWRPMAIKTVLRDMINRGMVPMSAEHRQIVERDNDDVRSTVEYEPMPTYQPIALENGGALIDAPKEASNTIDGTAETIEPSRETKPSAAETSPSKTETKPDKKEMAWKEYREALEAAEEVGQTLKIRDKFFAPDVLDKYDWNELDRKRGEDMALERQDRIRATRGTRSNKKS